ncbi:MAG TPA: ribosome maturation factor RimM [Bryobacteraceae bacterium]|nr:ribosome maturation factor RimM [Bryobacteraceae bacterium]
MTLARLTRARGIRGEISGNPFGCDAERFGEIGPVHLFAPDESRSSTAEIEEVWEHQGFLVFKFCGIDTRTEAEELQGWEVRIPMEQRRPVPKGEYYQSDLVGFEVVERTGRTVGRVTGWRDFGGPGLLAVEHVGSEILIPFAKAICTDIDLEARRITVDLPEGLTDIK